MHSTHVVPLALSGVTVQYGETLALDDLGLRLESGVTALVGINGAGKTTLMSVVSGACRPALGDVVVGGGHDPYGRGRRAALAAVALMPQHTTFPRSMTALEVVEYLAWMRGLPRRSARQRAADALDRVGLGARMRDRIGRLSGGMVRRVALAQALASDAEVLLLDEPSTGLDPEQRRAMVDLVKGLDRTVLMSSHVLEDVVDTAGRVLVLHQGRLVFDGSVPDLMALAPDPTDAARAAEVGFLQVIATAR